MMQNNHRPPRGRLQALALTALSMLALASPAGAQITPYLNFSSSGNPANVPPLLSQTGAFTDLETLTPIPGLEPFDVNQPLWSDGSKKFRWAGVPTGTGATFRPTGKWDFPVGSVLVKHFELGDGVRVETRFEIFKPSGGAYFATYQWRADQTEADLVSQMGADTVVQLGDGTTQNWHFPSRLECMQCHNDAASPALGPNTRQLNRPAVDTGVNQLERWNLRGLFDPPIDVAAIPTLDKLRPVTDDTAPLEMRVRSYFDINCGVCHNPVEPIGSAAPFDFRFDTPLELANVINIDVLTPLGAHGTKVIKAQDPLGSVALTRMVTDNIGLRMPPVGRELVDPDARDVILEWLLTLDAKTGLDVAGASHHWPFEDSLDDIAGGQNGTGTAGYTAGVVGQALDLPGSGTGIAAGNFDLPSSEVTISLWLQSDDIDRDAALVSKATGTAEDDVVWSLEQYPGGGLRFSVHTDGSTTTIFSPDELFEPGSPWVHIAATFNANRLAIYVDALEVASAPRADFIEPNPAAAVTIGWRTGAATAFDGRIDDLRLYSRGLNGSEVDRIFQAGIGDNTAPTATMDSSDVPLYILAGDPLVLTGDASDPEDGDLSASGVWYSSLEGELDTGASYSSTKRALGRHLFVFTANDSDELAASASREVTIVPGLARYLKDAGLEDGDADPLADTDGDGLKQIQEYAFSFDPNAPDLMPVRAVAEGGIAFPVWEWAIDIEYVVQFSADLVEWEDGPIYRPTGAGVERIDVPGFTAGPQDDQGQIRSVSETLPGAGDFYFRLLVRESTD